MTDQAWPDKRLLFIGQYPLTSLDSAPQVRISSLRAELAARCRLGFLCGSREGRRGPLWRRIIGGGWRHFDGVYIEAASSTAMEADLILLWLWHQRGIPVSIYIRDAYPLFDDYFDSGPWKHRLLRQAWHVTMAAYTRFASILYFPTKRLAEVVPFPDKRLLPPAGTLRELPKGKREGVIYVGEVEPVSGIQTLLAAAEQLAAEDPEFRLTVVCRTPERLKDWRDRGWLTVASAHGEALSARLLAAAVAVVPRPRNPYNDLCLPVKLLDYFAHGLPVVVTDCPETAAFVKQVRAGEVVPATPDGLAAGIRRLLDHPEHWQMRSLAAELAVRGNHSWAERAQTILRDLFGQK